MVSSWFTWIDANRQKQIFNNKVLVRNIEYKKMFIFLAFDVLKEAKIRDGTAGNSICCGCLHSIICNQIYPLNIQ